MNCVLTRSELLCGRVTAFLGFGLAKVIKFIAYNILLKLLICNCEVGYLTNELINIKPIATTFIIFVGAEPFLKQTYLSV